jgi:hypothetical protein
MKLLKNYIKAVEELEEYFGIDDLNYYALEMKDDYFSVFDGEEIGWAETEEDLENQDGEYYQEAIRKVVEKEELTLVLVDNDMGGDNYWIIFETKNKRDY